MEATRTLLFLFTSFLLLYSFSFTPICQCTCHRSPIFFNHLLGALTIFGRNQNEPKFPTTHEDNLVELVPLAEDNVNDCPDDNVWPLIFEEDVVALTEKNFSDFMAENNHVMVLFYAPWCYWSKTLAPEYGAAAKMLKGEAVLAMVDCSVDAELGRKHEIQAYPTMYFFVDGVKQNLYDFKLARTQDAITNWVRRKMAIGIHNITTMDKAICTLNAESELVLGYLDYLEGPESEELAAAAELHRDIDFYQTARADVAQLFHIDPQIQRPALILLKTVSRKFSIFHGQFTRLAIADFLSKIKHPRVTTFTAENAGLIFQNAMKQLWLFAPKYGSEKVISTFEEAAVAFREKLLFVHVEMNSGGIGNQIAHEFGVTGEAPRVIAYRSDDAKKHVLNGELTLSSIKSFGKDFLEDKLLSQTYPISESVLKLPSESLAYSQLRFHM